MPEPIYSPKDIATLERDRPVEKWRDVIVSRDKHHDLMPYEKPLAELGNDDLVLYRVEEITFEEDAPRLEALENALTCMSVPGVNLVYLILGDESGKGVRFYFGFARDPIATVDAGGDILSIGRAFLKPALEGNFRGSLVKEVDYNETKRIRELVAKRLSDTKTCETLFGVPGGTKDKETQDFRGIDRLVDVMQGDEFGLMIIAKPIGERQIRELRNDVFAAYEMLATISKRSVQLGQNANVNLSHTINTNITHGITANDTVTRTDNIAKAIGDGWSRKDGDENTVNGNKTVTKSESLAKAQGRAENTAIGKGTADATGAAHGSSFSVNADITNKAAEDWVKYFDEVLIPRLDYARGKGAFAVNMVLLGENFKVVKKLSNVARSIFSGDMANRVPLISRDPSAAERSQLTNFALPYAYVTEATRELFPFIRSGLLEYSGEARIGRSTASVTYAGNWMSVRELATMASLPQKEVTGLRLKEEVEFGLNVPLVEKKDADGKIKPVPVDELVKLGSLVKSGNICRGCTVNLGKDQLDRHVFVAGVTGSGKTTTCQTLLLSSGCSFLVIEPAKTEYRGLRNPTVDDNGKEVPALCPNLLVFTLGDDNVAPFRLNPFELIPGESVTARVDMLMASISAAFDMEAAIPQLIERAIYLCYEDYGWRLETNRNIRFTDENGVDHSFDDGVFAFPTLSEVIAKTERVVNEQGFDDRLKRDYIGSIKARLLGLTLGAKGFMLDCPRSVNFMELLDKRVVLELESIPNVSQKSLIIGFVLTNLLAAIKRKFIIAGGVKVNHITLIEEAHRLLSKPDPGGNPSQRQAAETFADMLAEIRKYGESLVIADQIPGKLTPEVMKNTNTKIIHRLFAQDDKEAVGHTMGLEEEQSRFLSNLPPGRAIVFNGSWPKAVQVQITQKYRTDSKTPKNENQLLRNAALAYYVECKNRGVYALSDVFDGDSGAKELGEAAELASQAIVELSYIPSHSKYDRSAFVALPWFAKKCKCNLGRLSKALASRMFHRLVVEPELVDALQSILKVLADSKSDICDCKRERSRIANSLNYYNLNQSER